MKRNVSLMILLSLCATASAFAQVRAVSPAEAPVVETNSAPVVAVPSAPMSGVGASARNSAVAPRSGSASGASSHSASGAVATPGVNAAAPAANDGHFNRVSIPVGPAANDNSRPAAAVRTQRPAARPAARASNPVMDLVERRVREGVNTDVWTRMQSIKGRNAGLYESLVARVHSLQTTTGLRTSVASAVEAEVMMAEQHGELLVGPKVGDCTGNADGKSFSNEAKDTLAAFEGGNKTLEALNARASEAAVFQGNLQDYRATSAGAKAGDEGYKQLAGGTCQILNAKAAAAVPANTAGN